MAEPKILIVDDNPSNIMVTQFMLEDLGFDSDDAAGGPEALELIAQTPYDVIFLDWMMPGMDGMQVLERIKSNPKTADIKVILCTAKETREDQRMALSNGASAFLSKPLTLHSLRAALRKVDILAVEEN